MTYRVMSPRRVVAARMRRGPMRDVPIWAAYVRHTRHVGVEPTWFIRTSVVDGRCLRDWPVRVLRTGMSDVLV